MNRKGHRPPSLPSPKVEGGLLTVYFVYNHIRSAKKQIQSMIFLSPWGNWKGVRSIAWMTAAQILQWMTC